MSNGWRWASMDVFSLSFCFASLMWTTSLQLCLLILVSCFHPMPSQHSSQCNAYICIQAVFLAITSSLNNYTLLHTFVSVICPSRFLLPPIHCLMEHPKGVYVLCFLLFNFSLLSVYLSNEISTATLSTSASYTAVF